MLTSLALHGMSPFEGYLKTFLGSYVKRYTVDHRETLVYTVLDDDDGQMRISIELIVGIFIMKFLAQYDMVSWYDMTQ